MKRLFALMSLLIVGWGGYQIAQSQSIPAKPVKNTWNQWTQQVRRQLEPQLENWQQAVATPAPTGAQLTRYEKMLCDMANAERKKHGLPLLKISPALSDVARGHSREMAQKNYFAHESPTATRRTIMNRYMLKFKRTPRLVAENIFKMETSGFYQLSERDFRRAHEGWMKSPGHRANILRSSPAGGPSEIGVGIVVKDGSFWATQNFSRPM
jgi:uncharacterized protein YkwD